MTVARIGRTIDLLATIVAVVAVWVGTPVGGIAERVVRKAVGLEPPTKALTAYFDVSPDASMTWVVDEEELDRPFREPAEEDQTVKSVAETSPVPGPLARAFAVVASGGRVAKDASGRSWYDVRPLDHHVADRKALGLAPMGGADAVLDEALGKRMSEALELLSAYEAKLGSEDAALAAWALGLPLMERAVGRASLLGESKPAGMDALSVHLTQNDLEKARGFVNPVQALRVAYEMKWPMDARHPITSFFGMRTHPILGDMRMHTGVDLGAPAGTPFFAAADGVIKHTGSSPASGLNVLIDHGHGLSTAYLHASAVHVSIGERVKAGDAIGRVGSTGLSTGPHLHFGVYLGGRAVDPLVFRPPDLALSVDPRGVPKPPERINPGARGERPRSRPVPSSIPDPERSDSPRP